MTTKRAEYDAGRARAEHERYERSVVRAPDSDNPGPGVAELRIQHGRPTEAPLA
jgi:hypothetical protein